MLSILVFLFSNLTGYVIFKVLSHPDSRVKKKLPTFRVKGVQVMPTVRIFIRKKEIKLHHWMSLTVVLVITVVSGHGLLEMLFAKGFMTGGILQGLRYPDWKQIVAPVEEKG